MDSKSSAPAEALGALSLYFSWDGELQKFIVPHKSLIWWREVFKSRPVGDGKHTEIEAEQQVLVYLKLENWDLFAHSLRTACLLFLFGLIVSGACFSNEQNSTVDLLK